MISCKNTREEIAEVTEPRIGVETANDVTIVYSIGPHTKAKITAPVMLRHLEANTFLEFPNTLSAIFYNDSLQVESRLTAHYAQYFENESRVFLRDSVVVYNNVGDTLFCNELYWDRYKTGHEFYTDKPVRIRTLTHIIDGDGLDAPQDFKSWHVVNSRGIIRLPAGDLP
ncbi:MAG: LPS export ABC transporter periplasmic protein LptC [Chitinophagaceae bacterium]|nr:LPS export ABC transporter periplasmic protein LptC [Chitinophagaceae bacterium]